VASDPARLSGGPLDQKSAKGVLVTALGELAVYFRYGEARQAS